MLNSYQSFHWGMLNFQRVQTRFWAADFHRGNWSRNWWTRFQEFFLTAGVEWSIPIFSNFFSVNRPSFLWKPVPILSLWPRVLQGLKFWCEPFRPSKAEGDRQIFHFAKRAWRKIQDILCFRCRCTEHRSKETQISWKGVVMFIKHLEKKWQEKIVGEPRGKTTAIPWPR